MKRTRRYLLLPLVVVASALVVVFGNPLGAVAMDDPNTIHACRQKNGNLRVVSDPSDCRPSEDPISWSTGPTGPVAYAHVEDGVLDPTRSKNVIRMTISPDFLGFDVYCFVLTATPKNVVATGMVPPFPIFVTVAETHPFPILPCPGGTDAAVMSGTGDDGNFGFGGFFALFN